MIGYIEEMDKENLFNCIGNILETVTEKKYNVISEIKEFLKDKGAVNSLMSGSGPTVFAIFNSEKTAQLACDAIQKEYDLDIAKVVTLI
jgi:4-diphosphocytidyl-2-C-methyl-D-erythritol kinase